MENTVNNSIAIDLIELEKGFKRTDIEELILLGEYEQAKEILISLGEKIYEIHDKIEEMEQIEDCDCIQNITKEEFESYLKSIGGLESGHAERYYGYNKTRRVFFKAFNWILKRVAKNKKLRNPFRSVICEVEHFSVGPGWYGLLKRLIEDAITAGWNKELCQSKEKFGGLRFYINDAPSEVHDIIHKYEGLSHNICEDCGSAGQTRPGGWAGGWIRTLCDSCCKTN